MMIIMHPGATQEQVDHVIEHIKEQRLSAHTIIGVEQTIIGAVGESHTVEASIFETLPGVQAVQCISQPYKLASRQFHPENSIFSFDGFNIGGKEVPIIAGPCLVESRSQILETATRNTTDINAIPVLMSLTHLPVILEPSYSTGHADYVTAIAKAAVAAGADGLIVEVHPDPAHAVSDGCQSLTPESFADMVHSVKAVAEAVDRRLVHIMSPLSLGTVPERVEG